MNPSLDKPATDNNKKGHRTKKMKEKEQMRDSESASARWSATNQARSSLPAAGQIHCNNSLFAIPVLNTIIFLTICRSMQPFYTATPIVGGESR